jgi:hypothetical protein
MKSILHKTLLGCSIGLAALLATPTLAAQDTVRPLGSDPVLESMRAGAVDESARVLVPTERADLAAAFSPMLEDLRATDRDFSDNEVKLIIVAGAVLVLLVVLL